MKSTTTVIALLASATALIAAPAAASQQGAAQPAQQNSKSIKIHTPKVSSGAGKAIIALQKAVEAKDQAAIASALTAARAAAKTADDRYAIGAMHLKAAADAKNDADIAAAIEEILASGAAAEDEKYAFYLNLAATYDSLKQETKAAQAYQQALQYNPSSIEAIAGVAESKAAQGQTQEALAMLQKGIAVKAAAGTKAEENWYKRAVAIAYKAKLPQAVTASREWLEAYPNETAWHDALSIYQEMTNLDELRLLDVLRLKHAAGAMESRDYAGLADIAIRKGYSGEAMALLDEGFASGKIDRGNATFKELYGIASQKTKGDRASLPTAPEADTNARQTLNVGDAWYGYGDYAKAVEFYRSALTKDSADIDLINLHIGMALARSGDKAGAVAALQKVGPGYSDIAKYWLIYANTKA